VSAKSAKAKWYVTFSGESGAPIQNVYAVDSKGKTLNENVLGKGADLNELRGMALGSDGTLYVADAHQTISQILSYSATINSDGSRDYIGVVVNPTSPKCESLDHPYALVFSGRTLFVSNQDTGIVSTFDAPLAGEPATPTDVSSYLKTSFPTDHFLHATFVACSNKPNTPKKAGDRVPASEGGLAYVAKNAAKKITSHAVRGLALGTKPAALYVCDQAGNRVTIYHPDTGTYLGQITGHGLAEPVGIAVDPVTGSLAIGSPGNTSLYSCTVPSTFPSKPVTVKPTRLTTHKKLLDGVSGLAYDTDGTLYVNARNACKIVTWNGSTLTPFVEGLTDTPEVLLRVS
jgi:hypothetical protein